MKLKLDEQGHVVVQDNRPVYVKDDGTDVVLDPPAMFSKITALNREAQTHREAKEAAETKLKEFDGIADPAAARAALDTVKNLDDKKLVDAGEVEKIKAAARKAADDQLAEVNKSHALEIKKRDDAFATLQSTYNGEKITGAFAGSKFVAEKLAIPFDIAEARFGKQFAIEDGRIVAKDVSGNKIFSRSKAGDLAEFEEALEMIVDSYPQKDHILKPRACYRAAQR